MALSIFVWVMIGLAVWHFSVLVPDRFWGGIIGAFGAANPPGTGTAIWAMPGSLTALLVSYLYGTRQDQSKGIVRD